MAATSNGALFHFTVDAALFRESVLTISVAIMLVMFMERNPIPFRPNVGRFSALDITPILDVNKTLKIENQTILDISRFDNFSDINLRIQSDTAVPIKGT